LTNISIYYFKDKQKKDPSTRIIEKKISSRKDELHFNISNNYSPKKTHNFNNLLQSVKNSHLKVKKYKPNNSIIIGFLKRKQENYSPLHLNKSLDFSSRQKSQLNGNFIQSDKV